MELLDGGGVSPVTLIGRGASLSLNSPPDDRPALNGFPARTEDLVVEGTLNLIDTRLDMGGKVLRSDRGTLNLIRSEVLNTRIELAPDLEAKVSVARLDDSLIQGGLINGGRVLLGASPGSSVIEGDYTQLESGELEIEIAGTEPGVTYDQLEVTNRAVLDGRLTLAFLSGYRPPEAEAFHFLKAPTIEGSFAELDQSRLGREIRMDLVAMDGGLMAESKPLVISSYESWKSAYFTPSEALLPEISGPDRDPDGDGVANLIEYVSGGNPHVADALMVEWDLRAANEGVMVLPWLDDVADVSWSVELSEDLSAWQALGEDDVDATILNGQLRLTFPFTEARENYARLQLSADF